MSTRPPTEADLGPAAWLASAIPATARYSTNYYSNHHARIKSGQLDVVPVGGVTILLRLVLLFVGLLKTSCYLLYYFNHHHSTTHYYSKLFRSTATYYYIHTYYVLAFVYFKVVKRNHKKLVKLLSWKSVSPPLLCTTVLLLGCFFLMSPTFFCIIFLHIVMKEKKSPLNTTLVTI